MLSADSTLTDSGGFFAVGIYNLVTVELNVITNITLMSFNLRVVNTIRQMGLLNDVYFILCIA